MSAGVAADTLRVHAAGSLRAALGEGARGSRCRPPAGLDLPAVCGLAVMRGAAPAAQPFVDDLLGPSGQAVLARHGFAPR